MLTLAIGDLFIPDRVVEIPSKFCKLLAPNAPAVPSNTKISQVLCLGNLTQSVDTLKFLHELSTSFSAVRGEYDDYNILSQQLALLDPKGDPHLPFYKVVTADNFRIGFTSGYQIVPRNNPMSLLAFAREIDVDILIWGGTHRVEAYTLDGKFFINPGSATGAFSFGWPELEEEEEEEEESIANAEEEIDVEQQSELQKSGHNDAHASVSSVNDVAHTDTENTSDQAKEGGETGKNVVQVEQPQSGPVEETVDHNSGQSDDVSAQFDASHLSSTIPSFCLLDTSNSKCTLYIYTYMNDEVKVDKVLYSRE